ncbi:MAG: ATP-dependent helicase HrpB [Holophagales bacterium]|nr:ATP-dependent helicase HrpB [Holophagales bacterium]
MSPGYASAPRQKTGEAEPRTGGSSTGDFSTGEGLLPLWKISARRETARWTRRPTRQFSRPPPRHLPPGTAPARPGAPYPRLPVSEPLPIDPYLPGVVATLKSRGTLVLVAPPGAGKTTRVPPALLSAGVLGPGALWVLQPRRVAARAAARRIASELEEPLGECAGYQIRDESVRSPRTRILVVTEGILTRRLLDDPSLPGVAGVMLDEFHERSRHADLALAMLREVRATLRPDLLLVVASATLDPAPVAAFLADEAGPAPVVTVPGRPFPVEVRHSDQVDPRPLEARVAAAVRTALHEGPRGDVLVFLPGAFEIRRAREAVESLGGPVDVRVLHGDLPGAAQDAALAPASPGRRRVILATNVAETSLTIEGVSTVVDSGLARTLRFDPRSGLDRLVLGRIPRASADQRAGRAGRLGPGLALRLFTRHEEQGLRPFEEPELFRTDLASPLLDVLLWTSRDPALFEWFERPPAASMALALRLLRRLGAVAEDSFRPTPRGARMAALPVHPRLSALVLAGAERGHLRAAATLAALVEERDVLAASRAFGGPAPDVDHSSDLLLRLELLEEAERSGLSRPRLSSLGLDPGAALAVLRLRDLILRRFPPEPHPPSDTETDLLRLVLAAYPDRIARRRRPAGPEAILAGGTPLVFDVRSSVRTAGLVAVIETSAAPSGPDRIRLASAVEREWLDALPGERVRTETVRSWDAASGRVVARQRVVYDDLVLEEKEISAPLDEETAGLLLEAARANLRNALEPGAGVDSLRARVAFLRSAMPELDLPPLDDEALLGLLPSLVSGRRRLSELRETPLEPLLKARLGSRALRLLDAHAPEALPVPSGRDLPLRYDAGAPPVLAVKLQELFGLAATPRVAGGRVPVLLHLLSPAGRPVQVTSDLSSFWSTTYPAVRREMRGRYPKHPWPEDPWSAPPRRGTTRSGR